MMDKCPLCGQPLPKQITAQQLQHKMHELASPFLAEEKKQLQLALEARYKAQLKEREEAVAKAASNKARAELQGELATLKKDAAIAQRQSEEAERRHQRELIVTRQKSEEEARKRIQDQIEKLDKQADRRAAKAAKVAVAEAEARLSRLEVERDRDRARYEGTVTRLQGQVAQLSHKLEKVTSEQLGDEAEVDLLARLRTAFPGDRIEPVGKGKTGADIVQHVMAGAKETGCIVYESKNVSTWQKAFVTKAKGYQRKYETPYVLVVSRSMPRKQRGLCVVGGIPIVEPAMAVALARIVRDAVLEVGELRTSRMGVDSKARRLFDYILSNDFRSRFNAITDAVGELRDQQDGEREWHEHAWQKRRELHERIENCRGAVAAKIRAATDAGREKPSLRVTRSTA